MNEMARVEVHEAVEDLLGDGAEDVHGDGPVHEEVLERARVHVLEHDARRAVDKERAVERDDVLAAPRRVQREQLAHHAARPRRAVRAALVVAALYLGAVPYRLRDFLTFLYEKPKRARAFGAASLFCAAALVIASTTY